MTQFHNSNSEENQESQNKEPQNQKQPNQQNKQNLSNDEGKDKSNYKTNYNRYDSELSDQEQEEAEARRLSKEEQKAFKARRYAIYMKTRQSIFYVVAALEILLGIRFVLGLAGANQDNFFANFIFNLSEPFAYPFSGLFPINTGTYIFDINLLFGMIVYLLLMLLVNWLLRIIIVP